MPRVTMDVSSANWSKLNLPPAASRREQAMFATWPGGEKFVQVETAVD
jgi:hypothetical protein